MACTTCDHTGWVCETHLDRPWAAVSAHGDACACGGGGTLCHCSTDPEGANAFAEIILETYRPDTLH